MISISCSTAGPNPGGPLGLDLCDIYEPDADIMTRCILRHSNDMWKARGDFMEVEEKQKRQALA